MGLLDRIFGNLVKAPQQEATLRPDEIAKKVSEFLRTRGQVAAESQKATSGQAEFTDRPPDVLQGSLSELTAAQITAMLRGKLPGADVLSQGEKGTRATSTPEQVIRVEMPTEAGAPAAQAPVTRLAKRKIVPEMTREIPEAPAGIVSGAERASRSPLQAMVQAIKDWSLTQKQYIAELKRLQVPVSKEVAGMSLDERYERLRAAGALRTPEAPRIAGEEPGSPEQASKAQIVEFSENEQQKRREARLKELMGARAQGAPKQVPMEGAGPGIGGIGGLLGVAAAHPVAAGVSLAMGAITIFGKKLADLSETMIEENKKLRRWSGRVAGAYGRLEIEQLRQERKLAMATEGSTIAAAEARRRSERAMAPYNAAFRTAANTLTQLYYSSKATAATLLQLDASARAILAFLKIKDERDKRVARQNQPDAMDFPAFWRAMQGNGRNAPPKRE